MMKDWSRTEVHEDRPLSVFFLVVFFFFHTRTCSGKWYQFSSHFTSWSCRDDFPDGHYHQGTEGVWLKLPVIRKHVTPALDSKWCKQGEGRGEFWRAPFTPCTTTLSCAMDPCGGVRREPDRADAFCNIRAEPGWLTTKLCCFGLFFCFSLKKKKRKR